MSLLFNIQVLNVVAFHSVKPFRNTGLLSTISGFTQTASSMAKQADNTNSAAAPVRTESSLPRRDAKAQIHRKNKKQKKEKKVLLNRPLNDEEIAHHVAEVYHTMSAPEILARKRRTKSATNALKTREQYANSQVISPLHGEHVKYLRQLDGHPALVLNADYQPLSHVPLSLWSWQDAIKAVFSGKVTVVESYKGVVVRAPSVDMALPAVIALKQYIPTAYKTRPSFTRRNVFLRDGYRCQYCNQRYTTGDLSLDHVVPRSRGGILNWENAVSCCKKCNGKKGSLLPSELDSVGMRLIREPKCPTQYELGVEKGRMVPRTIHPSWEPYVLLQ